VIAKLEGESIPLLSQEGKARWGGSKAETFRDGNHPSQDCFAIPLPIFLDRCALPGLHSQPLVTQEGYALTSKSR